MPIGLLGRKIGMTQIYDDEGTLLPVTIVEAGPCTVMQVRTKERDGYEAVQLGFDDKPRRLASRSERGHVAPLSSKRQKAKADTGVAVLEKPNCEPKRLLREFRTDGEDHGLEVGQELTVSHFEVGAKIDVIGTSKGRGTAGVMKRHNFNGQRASHGVKRVHRHCGSIGMSADPSRVLKGTRMAGRYGNAQITTRNLRIVQVLEEQGLLLVKGAIPGPNGGYVTIRPTNKRTRGDAK